MAIVSRCLHWNMDRERELGPTAVLTKRKGRDQEHRPATSDSGGGGDGHCIGWALLCQAFWLAPHRAYLIIITSWGRSSYTHLTDEESGDYIICSNAWQIWVWNWICLTVKLSSFLRWERYHCLSMIAALLFPFKAAPGVCSKQSHLSWKCWLQEGDSSVGTPSSGLIAFSSIKILLWEKSLIWAPCVPPTLWHPGPSPRTSRLPHDVASTVLTPVHRGAPRAHCSAKGQCSVQPDPSSLSLAACWTFGASPLGGRSDFFPGFAPRCRDSPHPESDLLAVWPSNCQWRKERERERERAHSRLHAWVLSARWHGCRQSISS